MVKVLVGIIILLLFWLFVSTPNVLLFYDAPEYIKIVSENSFFQSIQMGHAPIHPGFMAQLWIVTHIFNNILGISYEYAGNLLAFFNGALSLLILFKIGKMVFEDVKDVLLGIIAFFLFPGVWLIFSNLHVESFLLLETILFFWVYLIYLKKPSLKNTIVLFLSTLLVIITHIQGFVWIAALLLYPFVIDHTYKITRKAFVKVVLVLLLSLVVSIILYIFLTNGNLNINQPALLILPQYNGFFNIISIGRGLRNITFSVIRAFGTLTPILVIIALLKKRTFKYLPLVLLAVFVFVSGFHWTGDFMARRILFLAPLFSILILKNFSKLKWLFIIYLFPITFLNSLLYIKESEFPLVKMGKMQSDLPKNVAVIETHFVRPFTKFPGKVFWLEESTIDKTILNENEFLILDSQVVFAPFYQYVGNNLHITSQFKRKTYESQELFKNNLVDFYTVKDAERRIFAYQIVKEGVIGNEKQDKDIYKDGNVLLLKGKSKPSELIVLYSKDPTKIINRSRIDYGDIVSWVVTFILKSKDPIGFTFADRSGNFYYPIRKNDLGNTYLVGNVEEIKVTTIEN